jgi:mxaA protein
MMIKLMKQLLCACVLYVSFLSLSMPVYALNSETLPDVKTGVVTLRIKDPTREVGYTVGDVLTRHLVITIKKPYKLIDESLPIIGYEKRYRGQPIGIDLSDIKHNSKDAGDAVIHDLTLSYQVWTSKTVVKPGALPAEYLHLINVESKAKEVVKLRIPSFEFNISPIARFGQIKIEEDMSKYQGPLLLDNWPEKQRLKILLALLAFSLLGLLYMLGKYSWLPRMGGPFAKSYRQIHKLSKTSQANTPEAIQKAVSSMHSALNYTAGNSLFNDNLEEFLAKKPAFYSIKGEFQQFFTLSNQVFFEPNAKHNISIAPIQWLARFCRHCRDCERGLIPDSLNPDSKV